MGGKGKPRATGRRWVAVGLTIAVVLGVVPASAAESLGGEAPPSPYLTAREVRLVETKDFGLAHPANLAYDPVRKEFLVAGEIDGVTNVLRLGPYKDALGRFEVPELSDVSAMYFDVSTDRLMVVDDGELVSLPTRQLRGPNRVLESLGEAGREIQSASTDPDTGNLFLLDAASDAIVVVSGEDGRTETLDIGEGEVDRIIAYNSGDGLVYVLEPDASRLVAFDPAGEAVDTYDLSEVELVTPEAMVFAPTTDTTDDPEALNAFIVDSGDSTSQGGVMEVSLAQTVEATAATVESAALVQTIRTSLWNPPSTDPSGIVWNSNTDQLIVVDSEINEIPSLFQNVNMWRINRTGSVLGTGATWGPTSAGSYSDEPTGAGYDPGSNTLFISDDTGTRSVYVVRPGADGQFGTADDQVNQLNMSQSPVGASDTEDPEFDPVSGHLFVLGGTDRHIWRLAPVNGSFTNGFQLVDGIDISHLGPTDFEGLTSSPSRRTLFVGARTRVGGVNKIYEITHNGALVRTIDVAVSDMRFVSGLAMAPRSTNPSVMSLWVVDRGVDEVNDGQLFELAVSDLSTPVGNQAPVVDAGPDQTISLGSQATLSGSVSDDGLPQGGQLTHTWSKASGPGTVTFGNAAALTTTASFSEAGVYVLTLTASDSQLTASDQTTVTVTVPGGGGSAPAFRSASSAALTGASGSVLTIARPAGVQAGDVLLAQIRYRDATAGGAVLTAPAGWVEVGRVVDGQANHSVFYKVAGASEPASYSFDQNANAGRMAGGIGAYVGVNTTSPINVWAASAARTATLVAPSVSSTVDNTTVVRLWGWRGSSATDAGVGFNVVPAGIQERWSQQVGHSNTDRNRVLAGDQVKATAGSVGTATASGSASIDENRRSAFTIVLAPAGGGSPPVNQAPVAVNDSASTNAGQSVTVAVLANDSDADGDVLSVVNLTQPQNGSVVLNANQTVTYTPNGGFSGTDTFTYRASDGTAVSNVATVTITVNPAPPVNQVPVGVNDSASTVAGQSVTVAVLANDSDADGDVLSVVNLTQPQNGSVVLNANQTVTYTPNGGFSGTDTFTYRVSDGVDVSNVATVTITVDPAPPQVIEQTAVSQTSVMGSVSGSLSNTYVSNDTYLRLREVHTAGNPTSRVSQLEHRFTLNVVAGASVTFALEATRTANSENDDFAFSYSTNGGATWLPLVTVAAATDTAYQAALPNSTNGTVIVRVVDTDRTPGNGNTDTLFIDYLAILTNSPS